MKAVFHLDLDEEKILNIALTNLENLRKAKPEARITLLVNGPAVNFFRHATDAPHSGRVLRLLDDKVTIFLCANALRHFDIATTDICPGGLVVPAGVVALIELQQQGWAYIKP